MGAGELAHGIGEARGNQLDAGIGVDPDVMVVRLHRQQPRRPELRRKALAKPFFRGRQGRSNDGSRFDDRFGRPAGQVPQHFHEEADDEDLGDKGDADRRENLMLMSEHEDHREHHQRGDRQANQCGGRNGRDPFIANPSSRRFPHGGPQQPPGEDDESPENIPWKRLLHCRPERRDKAEEQADREEESRFGYQAHEPIVPRQRLFLKPRAPLANFAHRSRSGGWKPHRRLPTISRGGREDDEMEMELTEEQRAVAPDANEPGTPRIVDRSTFQSEVDALRVREKAHTREGDAIAAVRRRLPMVKVEGATPLIGETGAATLLEAFEGRRLLIAYYFMWHPGRPASGQCEGCTFFTSQIRDLSTLHAKDVTYATFCQGPYEESARYREFMGWEMPWYSVPPESLETLLDGRPAGRMYLICYLRSGSEVFETYWTTRRGVEAMDNIYRLLDLTVYGRQQLQEDSPPGWPQVEEGMSTDGRPTGQWPRLQAGYSDDIGNSA